MCILAHGDSECIAFDEGVGINLGDINIIEHNLMRYLPCKIKTLDIVACFCGAKNSEGKCIATEFASSEKIGEVFAWDGKMYYYLSYNSSIPFLTNGYYRFYRDSDGLIQKEFIGYAIKSGGQG